MKKRIIGGLLAVTVIGALLSGCGSSASSSKETEAKTEATEEVTEEAATEAAEEAPEETAEETAGETVEEETEGAGLTGEGLNEATTVRIGYQPLFGTHIIALEEKFHSIEEEFAKDNITVEFYPFEKGPALMEALAADGVDIADAVGETPFITAAASGSELVGIAAGKDDPDNAMYIIADEGSGIESIADLKGKDIAAAVGTSGHLFLIHALETAGLTTDDINFVNLADTDYLAALEGDSVDAAVTQATLATTIINTGAAYQIEVPKLELALPVFAARSQFAEENPELVARFLKVVLQYNDYATENREEVQQLIADTFDISLDSLTAYLGYTYDMDLDDSFYTRLQGSVDFLVDQETIEALDTRDVTDSRYLEEAERLYEEEK